MPQLVLDLLKYVFLAVLYVFVWRAVRVVYLELRPERRPRARAARPQPVTPARPPSRRGAGKAPGRLAVVEGGMKGKTFGLGDEIVIGRADKCHVVLDDTYVSQVHARIYPKDGAYMVEDLGSTNGTYLNRRRLTSPAPLQRGDQVKIGKTVLEARK
jgi:pSer/pThr/pTyr-binding forkhead associated (FHA) protein